jgi:ketosteroid isomerase-like protein
MPGQKSKVFMAGLFLLEVEENQKMLSAAIAKTIAHEWVAAWNSHDLEAIMSHYSNDVILTSPVAAQLLGTETGIVQGKDNLRAYFAKGLQAYPELRFELIEILIGMNSLVLYYVNQKGSKTAEFMEINSDGKISQVIANYSL